MNQEVLLIKDFGSRGIMQVEIRIPAKSGKDNTFIYKYHENEKV